MAAIKAGEAYIQTSLRGGDKLRKDLKAVTGRLKSVAAAGVKLAAVGLAAGAATFAAFSVKAASDLEETMNKFNVVFGENAGEVKKWGDAYAAQIGRSEEQMARFLSNAQDLLIPLGFEEGAATAMSQDLTILSTDLASFNNMADADVMRDLQSALTGSGEVMKKYGVIVSEAAVKQELLNQGLDSKNATNQQKVMARYNLILRGTTAAQGDATRSAGSFANQLKDLQGKALDFAANVGTFLLPILSDWIDELFNLVEALKPIAGEVDTAAGSIDGFGKSSAAAASPIEAMVRTIAALTAGFRFMEVALTQTLIKLSRLVELSAKAGSLIPGNKISATLGDYAKTFREDLERTEKIQVQGLMDAGNLAFGDGYQRLVQEGKKRRDASKSGAVGLSGEVIDTSTKPTKPKSTTPEIQVTETLTDELRNLGDKVHLQNQLEIAKSRITTIGTFAAGAVERIALVQAQQRQLTAREQELLMLKREMDRQRAAQEQREETNELLRKIAEERVNPGWG